MSMRLGRGDEWEERKGRRKKEYGVGVGMMNGRREAMSIGPNGNGSRGRGEGKDTGIRPGQRW